MLRDLLDSLRCPRAHDESWLVAMVHRAEGPLLIEADLACPTCGAEFVVSDGVARFDAVAPFTYDGTPDVMRLAALLNVSESAFPVLLAGTRAAAAPGLASLVPVAQIWVNAPAGIPAPVAPHSALEVTGRVPLGVQILSGAAVDRSHNAPDMLDSIVRAVRVGGRIVAPVDTPLPSAVKELARDATDWVAEVTTRASGLIELRRRAPDDVH